MSIAVSLSKRTSAWWIAMAGVAALIVVAGLPNLMRSRIATNQAHEYAMPAPVVGGYEIVKDPVDIRDLHATMLYVLGFDYHKLNYSFQGLEQKLTSVKPARVVAEVLA